MWKWEKWNSGKPYASGHFSNKTRFLEGENTKLKLLLILKGRNWASCVASNCLARESGVGIDGGPEMKHKFWRCCWARSDASAMCGLSRDWEGLVCKEISISLQCVLMIQLSGCLEAFCRPLLMCCRVQSYSTALKLGDKGHKLTGDLCCIFGKLLVGTSPQAYRGELCKRGQCKEQRVRVSSVPGGPSPPGLPSQSSCPSTEAFAESPPVRLWPVGNSKTSLFQLGWAVSLLWLLSRETEQKYCPPWTPPVAGWCLSSWLELLWLSPCAAFSFSALAELQ